MAEPNAGTSVHLFVAEAIHRSCTVGEVGPPDGLAITEARDALAALADWLESNPPRHQMRPRPEGLHHHSPYNDGYTDGWWAARQAVVAELRGQP